MRSHLTRILMLALLVASQLLLPFQARAEGEDDPLWNRPSFEKKVIDVGQRILAANGITERIEFRYDNHDNVRNAYAERYGGPNVIVVYKDMLDVTSSDDELAAVLSHEIAHITQRHAGKTVPKIIASKVLLKTAFITAGTAAIIATGGLAAPAVAVGAMGIKRTHQSGIDITDPIQRPYEKEADLVGLDYMVKAGYNPLAMETICMKFAGDSGPVANFFASHPGGTERLTYIHDAIKTKYPQFLTTETVNNPLPGSPYQLQPAQSDKPATGSQANPSSPSITNTALPASNPGTPTETIAHQQTTHLQLSPAESNETGLIKPPAKVSYQAPQKSFLAAPKPSAQTNNALKHNEEAASTSSSHTDGLTQTDAPTSVAQVLLGLSTDDLRALKLISQHGYISRTEFEENFEHQDSDTVWVMLTKLVNKRLIRIVGAAPDEGYVLTDWASDALTPPHGGSVR